MNALDYFNAELIEEYARAEARVKYLEQVCEEKTEVEASLRKVEVSLRETEATLRTSLARSESSVDYYKHRYELLVQKLFGKKSEQRQHDAHLQEALLPGFNDEDRPKPPTATERIEYTRKKRSPQGTRGARSTRFPEWLRRVTVEVPPESTTCPCCTKELTKAATPEVTEKLCYSRDPFYVKEFHRHLYTCGSCNTAVSKPPIPEVFEKSLFDRTTAASVIVNKFLYGIPLFRQTKMFTDVGI